MAIEARLVDEHNDQCCRTRGEDEKEEATFRESLDSLSIVV